MTVADYLSLSISNDQDAMESLVGMGHLRRAHGRTLEHGVIWDI